MKTNIGVATLMYDKTGKVTAASFAPAALFDKIDLNQLAQIKPDGSGDDEVSMTRNAELVLSSWFTRMNEIELADRDQFKISTEVLSCERYKTGEVMIFMASFSFEKI